MATAPSGDLLGLGDTPGGRSPGLTLNLASNNPFRNRAASPSFTPPPPHSPFDDPPPRPVSRNNPFLDSSQNPSSQFVISPDKMASPLETRRSPTAEELFDNLIVDDRNSTMQQSRPSGGRPPTNRTATGGPLRGENIPPHGRGPPPSSHRPTRSQEEAQKARRMQAATNGDRIIGGSPQKRSERRLRRNSESSVMEKPMTDEEKKLREMRNRDRERRHRDRDGKPRTQRKLDIIDQLDATSIYGTGLFHHDGPFDACNPHRNRKGSRRAPMSAFAKDSANNSIGGSGPVNKRPDHKLFMGHEPHEATSMYAAGVVKEQKEQRTNREELTFFDPKQRGEYEYGEETIGLGASTFLEGTPAARAAITRNQSETAQEALESGLGRKKSVVQRFRSIKRAPREPRDYESGRVTSPGAYYGPASALPTSSSTGERNPFFNEFDNKAEERISVKRKDSNPAPPPMSPPVTGAVLERRSTTDATMDSQEGQAKPASTGFLSRIKSVKGGRRQRPEVPAKDYTGPLPGAAM
ncbi:Uu.00g116420.m01.CDS01 [Anthostomella pinea]|uniref:Uu.00g116420.m01.CDS01 n=1 Tax=Anthostomella pinea TaxID=933095 RepID=A0AAI8VG26_9PEZI|nr:Uu.00g116420.m01.CDS01 [Anthostomella pinea]